MSELFRLATVEDAEELLDLTLRAYEPIRKLGIKFPAATATIQLVKENIQNSRCYIMEINGKIVATITARTYKEITNWPFLWWFAVDPLVKKKGVGSKLLTWVEETVIRDQLGAPAVTLATSDRHPWLIPMYERKGYERFFEVDQGEEGKGVFLRKILHPERYELEKHKELQQAN